MNHLRLAVAASLALLPLTSCVAARTPAGPPATAALYADPARWLCRPGRADACSATRTVVERSADGAARPVIDPPAAADPGIDCFYVYPTVTFSPIPRNADNFTGNKEQTSRIAQVQAASFRTACRVFAPFYRQGTIGTYILPERVRQTYVANALADVTAAFDDYMAHDNGGRRVVLIGHSQGGELVTRLLKARFDTDPALRRKLALAIVAGAPVWVKRGGTRGGSLANIPVCSRTGETGCVVPFGSHIEGTHVEPEKRVTGGPGEEIACVNPATLDNRALSPAAKRIARVPLAGTLLPPPAWSFGGVQGDKDSRTFTLIRDGYTAACATEPDIRQSFLSIGEAMAPGDPRRALVPFDKGALRKGLGLHVLDLQFPSAEMVALVKARAPK